MRKWVSRDVDFLRLYSPSAYLPCFYCVFDRPLATQKFLLHHHHSSVSPGAKHPAKKLKGSCMCEVGNILWIWFYYHVQKLADIVSVVFFLATHGGRHINTKLPGANGIFLVQKGGNEIWKDQDIENSCLWQHLVLKRWKRGVAKGMNFSISKCKGNAFKLDSFPTCL